MLLLAFSSKHHGCLTELMHGLVLSNDTTEGFFQKLSTFNVQQVADAKPTLHTAQFNSEG